jgi:bifunctional non-homologous end joining protein LigD
MSDTLKIPGAAGIGPINIPGTGIPAYREQPLIGPHHLALPDTRARPFSAAGWVFELQYDGYRCLAANTHGYAQLQSREGRDLSRAFPEIIEALEQLPEDTVIDGELVMLDDIGRPQYERLLGRAGIQRPESITHAAHARPATFFAWDILLFDGKDLRRFPLLARKVALEAALAGLKRFQAASHVPEHGERLFAEAVFLELEGIVGKRVESRYSAGRTADWVKIKTPAGRERSRRRMEHLAN